MEAEEGAKGRGVLVKGTLTCRAAGAEAVTWSKMAPARVHTLHDPRPLTRVRSNRTSFFHTLLQPTRMHMRSDLLLLDVAPKCCVTDYFQRARPHACRCSLVFPGRGPSTLREAGLDRLGCGASPRRRATRHPLDVHKARVVAYGAPLSDGPCGLPAPAEATASPEDTGCSQSPIARFHLGRTVCLWCGGRARPRRISRIWWELESTDQNSHPLLPTPRVALPFFARVILHLLHLLSLRILLSPSVFSFYSSQYYYNILRASK